MVKLTGSRRIIVFGLSVLLVVIVIIAAMLLRGRIFPSGAIVQTATIPVRPDARVEALDNGYVSVYQNKLTVYNAQGILTSQMDLTDPNAIISVGKANFAVCQNQQLSLYKEDGTMIDAPKTLNMNPSQILCAQTFIAVTDEASQNVYVILYSDFKSNLPSIQIADTTVLATGAFMEGKTECLWTITLDSSGSVPETTVTIYQPSGSAMTKRGGYTASDEVIYRFAVDSTGKKGYAIGTQYISAYNNEDGRLLSQMLAYGYQYIADSSSGRSYAIALAPSEQLLSGGYSSVRLIRDDAAKAVQLPAKCAAVVPVDTGIYAANESTVYKLDNNGKVVSKDDVEAKYSSVEALPGQRLLFRAETEAHVFKLP